MIKIKTIEKNKNNYFVEYTLNKEIYTFNGSAENILEDMHRLFEGTQISRRIMKGEKNNEATV